MDRILTDQISSLEHWSSDGEAVDPDPARFLLSLQAARSVITSVDRSPATRDQIGSGRWLRLVHMLQKLAYDDPDTGGEVDIALWCERQWATHLQSEPDNETALQGLGHAWLMKSQKTLALIYHEQGSSSTDTSSSSLSRNGVRTRAMNRRDAVRVNSDDYVEARHLLRPALESLDRAIEVSDLQGTASGDLLALAAEAYISFANVSHPRDNETYYQTALRLLRRASQIEGYELVEHLQHFLEENIRFVV